MRWAAYRLAPNTEEGHTMLHTLINIAFIAAFAFTIWTIYYTLKGN